MDISKILDSGGYVHNNPEYNPKTKKGKLQPQFIVNADPNGAINRGSALADVMSQPGRQGKNLDYLGQPEKYAEYDVTISPVDDLDKELANAQGAFSKLKNSVAQAAISEVALGTGKGISDLFDFIGSKILRVTDDDYSNPVSQYIGQLQEDFKAWSPVYADPSKNISNGGLTDMGWWASNLPSVMSSLTLMIPSTGITKGLGWLGKSLNAASKGKIGAFGRNAYKVMTGAGKAKTVEEAAKLNSVTRWLNDTNTMAAGQRMLETGVNAALMRTMENYQEAHQVYDDMKNKALDKFNTMSDTDYAQFINSQSDKLEGVDVTDKEAVASKLAKDAADRTFMIDYANTVFDVIQLNALRNPIKLLKNMRSNAAINEAQRASMSAIGKAAVASTEATAEKAGLTATTKKLGKGVGQFLVDSKNMVGAELSEGIEEAVNYIAQEEGMHYGNVALGEDIKNGFDARLGSYLRSPELYDAAFWGVLGGVVFQGLGSGLNRLSVAAERYNQQKKKKDDGTTKEGINLSNFQELFETSENKRRIADINARQNDFNDLVNRLNQIEPEGGGPGVDPFNTDENGQPLALETETEKTIARERAISEYITGMTFRAMDNGNFDMLKAYLQDSNVRQALEEATGNEGDGGAFIDSVVKRMDNIAEKYSNNLIALSNIARNVNIASESAIPLEYLQIIARDNTAAQVKLEDLNTRIATYETSAENKKATYGDKLDKSLNYKDAVQLVVLTQQLATLRAKKAEIEKSKDKQGIGRQIELDNINKNISIVENMIAGQGTLSNSDALTRLVYSTIQSNFINDKDVYAKNLDALMSGDIKSIIGEENAKKFKITDEELMKVLGEDKTSGAYKTLATDIDAVFEGQYGLNKIDKRLGDDYVALASLNIEKAVLNENIIMNESNLNKRVNELHNEMMDARKQAIDKFLKTLLDLAKKYGRQNIATNLETGQEIAWENEADKKLYDDALEVLNLTSANNQQLYDDVQYAIMMDEFIEASQNAANPAGENSTTSQNQNVATSQPEPNNQSATSGQTATGQENTLNNVQNGQTPQVQPQVQTPTPTPVSSTPTSTGTSVPSTAKQVIKPYTIGGNNITHIDYKNGQAHLYNDKGQHIAIKSMTPEEFNELTEVKPATISSTGGQQSSSPTKRVDDNGNPIPDAQREQIKQEIGATIMNAVKTAKQNSTDATEEINKAVAELNTKYGNDDEYKKEINRMANSWNARAKRQGLAKDVVDLVILASYVTEQGGKYVFPDEYLKAAKKFADDFLKAVSAKEFDGKKVVSFESMLRFANEQMEDPTTAQYIYQSLKAWFETNKKDYIVLDNMDSTSILQRAVMTDRQLADSRLGGTNVFRVQIDQFLMRNASKAAIDKLNTGDTLNAKVDNGDIILMVGDVEIGRLPQPKIDSATGGFKKTNNGWITDVALTNGTVVSKLRQIWEDILLNKSDINDKINTYIYQIIGAKKLGLDTSSAEITIVEKGESKKVTLKYAIENDTDLKEYFDGLKQQGIVDKNANNVELIDGLVGIWDYIDLTNPDAAERAADINYSLDLWFNKLYDTYTAVNNSITVGINNLNFKVARITNGDVNQVDYNNDNAYDIYTLGDGNKAFVDVESTELGVAPKYSVGVIQTTTNKEISYPNVSTGSVWAVLPNRGGIPGIASGHTLKFLDTDTTNTPALRIRTAFANRCYELIKDLETEEQFIELYNYLRAALDNRNGNIPLFSKINGSKFVVGYFPDNTSGNKIKITDKLSNFEFTINLDSKQYYVIENGNRTAIGYIDEDTFKSNFRNKLLGNLRFNADYTFFDSDANPKGIILNGLCSRDNNTDEFVITIPTKDGQVVERFPSFKHFLMQGGGARWNIKVENGSNWLSRSKTNQLRNQVLNVSIEANTSRPVEGIIDTSITPDTINNGQAIDTLLEKVFGTNAPQIKRLQEAGLIPTEITYTSTVDTKGGNPVTAEYSIGKKKIYVNDRWIQLVQDNPNRALRVLIHENLHKKLHSKGNQRRETLKRIQEIVDDFKKALDNDTNADPHLREYLFENIANNEERLEEFLVESLTNRELATYLNSVQTEIPGTKTKKSLLNKILDLLAEIFDWGVTEGSLYEKELRVLQGFTEETQQVETPATTETTVEVAKEEETSDDEFDEEDYDGMASSVEENTTPALNQFVESLPLEERVDFNKLLLDGTVSMKCS